jgi:PAS domain S-box-containing protein
MRPMSIQPQSKAASADGQFGRGQGVQFLILFGLLGIVAPIVMRISWPATAELHTLFDVIAVLLAAIVAHLTLIYHRHSRRDAQFYFVALGFLGAALLDAIHLVLTSPSFSFLLSSPLDEVAPWSWLVSRLVLAGFFLLNAATLSRDRARDAASRAKMPQYLLLIGVLTVSALLVFLLIPLPRAIFFGLSIPRPQEFVVAIPLGLAFVLYYRKRTEIQDPLFHWVLVSIVINLAIQLFLVPWSHSLFDAALNWAHLAKIASYFVVFFGLTKSMTDIIDQLRGNRDEIRRQNAELSAEVAERKKAEETIRIYRDIVANMQSGVYVLQLDDPADLGSFRFILGNRGAEVATGYPIEPVLNQRIDQAAPMLMETEFPQLYKHVLDTQEPRNLGDLHYPGDPGRSEVYFSAWLIPLNERHLAAIFENVTERKLMEKNLLTSRQELNEAQALAHVGSWSWQISTNAITWSDELYRIYGYEPGEVALDFAWYIEHIHPDDRELVQRTVDTALTDGLPFDYYHRIITAQGDVRIIQARGGYIETQQDAAGHSKPVKMWGTGQDVTAQRLVEEARRRNEVKLGQALSLSRMGHWEWDRATDRVSISTELAPIFGYGEQSQQISLDEFMEMIHADDRTDAQKTLREAFAGRSSLRTKFRILRAEGVEQGIECIGTTVTNDAGEVISTWGTCQDITDRLQMESQIKQYAAQLETSNRDLQDFAYIASHDLQEPLRKISAFGNRLAQMNQTTLDEKSFDYLNRMLNAAQRMQTLINDLLTLSRVSTRGQPFVRIDLNVKIQNVLGDLENQIEKTGGRVEVDHLPTIVADRVQMQQLFQNLISNGLKYHRADEPPVVHIYAVKPDGQERAAKTVTIVVEDNGIGFDQEYRDKIFQPFQRLHGRNNYEGTGMGLAICRRILERHGGSISAESKVGKGAKFILTFLETEEQTPLANGSEAEESTAEAVAGKEKGS